MINIYKRLKSGTDIRGVAVETQDEKIELTDEVVFNLTIGFCKWLSDNGINPPANIAVGHDSRISAERIKSQVILALNDYGYNVLDCGYASTPAMFMITVDKDAVASVQITASHHPYQRNGLKFFTRKGGLDHADIDKIVEYADMPYELQKKSEICEDCDYMSDYAKRLREMIKSQVNSENYDEPLKGYHIIVDAGNGVGGFYATDVLAPLGADIKGSQFLEKDGMFPNHIPNPENEEAMQSICSAVINNKADLGIIFDTDVDRAGCVDEHGNEINRNRLVALASIIALEGNDGGTVVTDSVTSTGLTDFINNTLHGFHYRYRRGYKNVINEQVKLNNEGINCPLAIETSGHAAFRENFYLDDGAYLMTKIVVKVAQMGKQGKKIESLIEKLEDPKEADELRFKINREDFKNYGNMVLDNLEKYAESKNNWTLADDNREGLRIFVDNEKGKGWFLLRLSVHDPIMPLNIESDYISGDKEIAKEVFEFIKEFEDLNIKPIEDFIK